MRAVSVTILLLLSACALATERPCGSYPAIPECVRSEIVIRSRAQPVYPSQEEVSVLTKDDEIEIATPAPPEDSEESDDSEDSQTPEDSEESDDSEESQTPEDSEENDSEDSEENDSEDSENQEDSEESDGSDENDSENDSEDTDSEDTENEESTDSVLLHLDDIIHIEFPTYYAKTVSRNITVSVGQTEIIDFGVWNEGYTTITVQITGFGLSGDYDTTLFVQDGVPLTFSSSFVSTNIDATFTTIIPGTTALDMDNSMTRLTLLREFDYDFGSGMEEAASQNSHIAELLDELNAEPMIFKVQMAEAYGPLLAKTFYNRNLFVYTGN